MVDRNEGYPKPQYNPEEAYQNALHAFYDTRIGGGSRNPDYAPQREDYYTVEAWQRWQLEQAYQNDTRG